MCNKTITPACWMETCRSCACQHVTCVNVCFENICGISRHLKRIYFIFLFTVALTGENYCLPKLVSMCTIFIRRSSARCQRSSATPTTELGVRLNALNKHSEKCEPENAEISSKLFNFLVCKL